MASSPGAGEPVGRGLDELERLLAPLAALEHRGTQQAVVLESEEMPGADAPRVAVVRGTVVVFRSGQIAVAVANRSTERIGVGELEAGPRNSLASATASSALLSARSGWFSARRVWAR